MLKNDGVAWVEAGDDFGFGAVRDAGLDIDLSAAVLLFGVGDFDGGVAIFVIEDGLLGNGENVFVLLEEDLGVRGHVGFEFAAWIVDGDADFEGGDVIFFDAEWGDFCDLALESFVFEGFDFDAGCLSEIDLADVGLVDFALHVNLSGVADGHDESGGRAEDEDGADGVTDLNVAGEDGAVHRRRDGGVAELLLKLFEGGFVLGYLGFGLAKLRGVDGDLGNGFVARIEIGEVLLLGVIKRLLGDDSLLGHLEVPLVGVLIHGKVGGFCVDLVVFDGSCGGAGIGLGCCELRLLSSYLIEDLLLVELGENLTLLNLGVDVGVEAGDDAGGFGFDFDLGDGLYLASGNNGASYISSLCFGQL